MRRPLMLPESEVVGTDISEQMVMDVRRVALAKRIAEIYQAHHVRPNPKPDISRLRRSFEEEA